MAGKCPYCDEQIAPIPGGEPRDHSGVATVWLCPVCDTILGVTEWMD